MSICLQRRTRLYIQVCIGTTESQLEDRLAELRKQFQRDRTLAESYLAFSEFLAKIKCGHTYANFFNQNDTVAQELFEKGNKVPFTFKWIGRSMVVLRDASKERAFPRGTEILAINGVPSDKILAKLMRVFRADGSNDAKRIADLEVLGTSQYEAFDVYFPMYYPSDSNTYRFRVRKPRAKSAETIEATMVSASARQANLPKPDATSPAWTLTYPRTDVALLQMPTWVMYN
jgi:hypothetical protein